MASFIKDGNVSIDVMVPSINIYYYNLLFTMYLSIKQHHSKLKYFDFGLSTLKVCLI